MHIDGLTFIAQLLNFLLLLWLLKRFLFGRIADAMARRQQHITARLEEAAQLRLEAKAEGDRYRELEADLAARRDQLLDGARQQASTLEAQLLDGARQRVAEEQDRWQHSLHQQQQDFLQRLRQRASHEGLELCRRVLDDLAGRSLEAGVADRMVERLGELKDDDRQRLRQALEDAGGEAQVTSTLPVSTARRHAVRQALEGLGPVTAVTWLERSELGLGFTITTSSWQLSWNLESYLDELSTRVATLLDEQQPARAESVGEPSEVAAG